MAYVKKESGGNLVLHAGTELGSKQISLNRKIQQPDIEGIHLLFDQNNVLLLFMTGKVYAYYPELHLHAESLTYRKRGKIVDFKLLSEGNVPFSGKIAPVFWGDNWFVYFDDQNMIRYAAIASYPGNEKKYLLQCYSQEAHLRSTIARDTQAKVDFAFFPNVLSGWESDAGTIYKNLKNAAVPDPSNVFDGISCLNEDLTNVGPDRVCKVLTCLDKATKAIKNDIRFFKYRYEKAGYEKLSSHYGTLKIIPSVRKQCSVTI